MSYWKRRFKEYGELMQGMDKPGSFNGLMLIALPFVVLVHFCMWPFDKGE